MEFQRLHLPSFLFQHDGSAKREKWGSDAHVWASSVTFFPGLEPNHLGCNYNFNFITIKAMTSLVALKRKTQDAKKLQPLQSAAEPSCSVYTRELRLQRPADHLMWFFLRRSRSEKRQSSSCSLRNGNISVLTNMHISAAC